MRSLRPAGPSPAGGLDGLGVGVLALGEALVVAAPPAGHTCGWHSYISMRFRHSDSNPHGFSSPGLQLPLGISGDVRV